MARRAIREKENTAPASFSLIALRAIFLLALGAKKPATQVAGFQYSSEEEW